MRSPWPVVIQKIHHSERDGQHTENQVRDGQVYNEDIPGCPGDFVPYTSQQYCQVSTKPKRENEDIHNTENVEGCRGHPENNSRLIKTN